MSNLLAAFAPSTALASTDVPAFLCRSSCPPATFCIAGIQVTCAPSDVRLGAVSPSPPPPYPPSGPAFRRSPAFVSSRNAAYRRPPLRRSAREWPPPIHVPWEEGTDRDFGADGGGVETDDDPSAELFTACPLSSLAALIAEGREESQRSLSPLLDPALGREWEESGHCVSYGLLSKEWTPPAMSASPFPPREGPGRRRLGSRMVPDEPWPFFFDSATSSRPRATSTSIFAGTVPPAEEERQETSPLPLPAEEEREEEQPQRLTRQRAKELARSSELKAAAQKRQAHDTRGKRSVAPGQVSAAAQQRRSPRGGVSASPAMQS